MIRTVRLKEWATLIFIVCGVFFLIPLVCPTLTGEITVDDMLEIEEYVESRGVLEQYHTFHHNGGGLNL